MAALRTVPFPRRVGWYWILPYVAVVLFAVSMLGLVWNMERQEAETQRAALVRDVLWASQTMRLHMQATEDFLGQLARDLAAQNLTADDFQLRANQHIANNAELVNIVWVGEGEVVQWSAPFDTTDWLAGDPLSGLQSAPFFKARDGGVPGYGEPYTNARGSRVLEFYVPVWRARRFMGCIVAVYAVDRLLRYMVPGWFSDKYQVSLLASNGEALVSSAHDAEAELRGASYAVLLDPPGHGLQLRASALKRGGGLPPGLPTVLIVGLSVCVLWSLFLLRTHVLRRVQVEKERDRLFNLSLDLLCVFDQEGLFRRCNPAFERILGLDPETLPGTGVLDLVHEDDVAATLVQFHELASGRTASFENRCRCVDGSYKWLQWSANPVREEGLIFAVAHDVTRRREAEDALRSETSFRKAMEESVVTGMRAIDLEGRIIYVNPAFCRMVGYTQQELVGARKPFPYWSEDELDRCQQILAATLAGQAPRAGFEMRIKRRDGLCIDTRFYLSPLVDGDGVHRGWMASVTDITEPKRIRAALETAHERFEAVLDGLDAAVFVADAHTDEILFANRAFKNIHGYDTVGRSLRGLAIPQPERGDYRVDPRRLTLDDLPRELFDGELQHPLSGRWYHVREQATRWVDGRVVRMGIATDITDRKHTEVVARQQEERLQRTARLITMGEMASTLAHELNQPLAAIANYSMGCVTRLEAGAWQQEDLLAAMRKAGQQAERAGKIIRRIRDFVKKSEPRRTAVRLEDVLEDSLGFAEIDARRVGVQLLNDVPDDLPPVFADRIMIEQVLLNLVRNGIEAMSDALPEHRELHVRARLLEGGRAVEVAVSDRGHGISEADRERLFTAFYTTKSEGMGMGLNICRSIIEFHEGRLWVEDNPGGGTIFLFTLPTELAGESHRAEA